MDTILRTLKDTAIGSRIEKKEKLTPIEYYKEDDLADKEIIEQNGKKFVQSFEEKEIYGYNVNRG